jgi:hypothetical protein
MGSFISNLHVHGTQSQDVIGVLQSLRIVPTYVTDDPTLGWVSVFPEAGEQIFPILETIGVSVSQHLQRPVIATLVHDSDIFMYSMIENGALVDRYDSAPGYFEGEKRMPEGGNVEVMKRFCSTGTSTEQLIRLLHQKIPTLKLPAEDTATQKHQALEILLKRLRENYPRMAAHNPNLPSLEQMLAQAAKRFADPPASTPRARARAGSFVFAEDMAKELGALLGISARRMVDSYHYLRQGEGELQALLYVDNTAVAPATQVQG